MTLFAVTAAWILVSLSAWRLHRLAMENQFRRGYRTAANLAINVRGDIDQL